MTDPSRVLAGTDVACAPLWSVGVKSAVLARLAAEGFPVPPFFVVASPALDLHLRENEISWPGRDPGPQPAADDLGTVRTAIATSPVPGVVAGEVRGAYERLVAATGSRRVAVRSSGADEDGLAASFAGQFESFLNVEGAPAVLDAVTRCWASSLSDTSMGYRAASGLPLGEGPTFAVMVQSQVFAEKAGVLFTVHPLDPEGDPEGHPEGKLQGPRAYLEANFGTGASVAAGIATPDAITLARSGEPVGVHIATKRRAVVADPATPGTSVVDLDPARRDAPVLTPDEAASILDMGLRIEALLGGPQDVEWAIDGHGLWVVQSRPITGLVLRRRA